MTFFGSISFAKSPKREMTLVDPMSIIRGYHFGGCRRRPRHVQANVDGFVDVRDLLAGEGVEARVAPL